jgi:hypothetical protein
MHLKKARAHSIKSARIRGFHTVRGIVRRCRWELYTNKKGNTSTPRVVNRSTESSGVIRCSPELDAACGKRMQASWWFGQFSYRLGLTRLHVSTGILERVAFDMWRSAARAVREPTGAAGARPDHQLSMDGRFALGVLWYGQALPLQACIEDPQNEVESVVIAEFAFWPALEHQEMREDTCGELRCGELGGDRHGCRLCCCCDPHAMPACQEY